MSKLLLPPFNRPIIDSSGVLTEEARVFFSNLVDRVPSFGSGSPVGVVSGAVGATYYDVNTGDTYIKVFSDVGGDDTLGWQLANSSGGDDSTHGFIDYNDTSTATTPLTLVADTWTDIPNNGLGAFTNKTFAPEGVPEILDTSTGYLDFQYLPLGSEIIVRNDFSITPDTNNALLEARYELGSGLGTYPLQFWSERLDSGSGIPYQRVTSFPIYMGDTNTQQNAGKLQIRLSTTGTVYNAGVYVSIRKAG